MMNIVIPMAGRGSRFADAGFEYPKPLINVNGAPMIKKVIDNLNFGEKCRFIFMVLKEHYEKYALEYLLPALCGENECRIVIVDQVTEGAACTVLLAKKYIDNNDELMVVNSDQYIKWEPKHFLSYIRERNAGGGIVTFLASGTKWSFAKVNDDGVITEVAEKNPISNIGTTGHYYFRSGRDFVIHANRMIEKNIRVNNEFYLVPVYNEFISNHYKILNYPIPRMFGLGTPEDLEQFLGTIWVKKKINQ